jgi:hypothetical protein
MWQYCELKSAMLNTLKFGMRSKYSTNDEDINVIKSTVRLGHGFPILEVDSDPRQKMYNTAKDNLLDIACILHENEIEVDVDNFHEDLSKLDTSSDYDTEKSPKMGFLSAKPCTTRFSEDTVTTDPCPYSRELGTKRQNSGKA